MTPRWTFTASPHLTAADWASWETVNGAANGGHPLLSADMVRCLLAHFGSDDIVFASLQLDGRNAGHALLKRGRFGEWSLFCPDQSPLGLIVLDGAARAQPNVMSALRRTLPGFTLALSLPLQDEPFSALPQERAGIEMQLWGTTIAVECAAGFNEYWNQRSKDLRKNIRRYLNRAEENSLPPRLVVTTATSDMGAAVDRYGQLESRGWKGAAGTALHPDNAQGAFYRALLQAFAERGRARVYELFLGERLAAARLLIGDARMHVILKTAFDEELKQYAPGRLLLHFVLQNLLDEDATARIEFYTRANKDSLTWATHTRPIVNASLFRGGWVRSLTQLRRRLLQARQPQQIATTEAESA